MSKVRSLLNKYRFDEADDDRWAHEMRTESSTSPALQRSPQPALF